MEKLEQKNPMQTNSATPLLRQYFAVKEQHPTALVLFQVGDFYELFFDDAKKAAAFLGIALTKRGTYNDEPVPLCGVPVHALDHYLVKLVKGGFRVAICDQLTEAQPGKVVERGVTHVLTPGTLTDMKLLDEKSASYCATIFPTTDAYGCLFVELLTGHIFVTSLPCADTALFEAELRRFSPDEIVIPNNKLGVLLDQKLRTLGYCTTSFNAESVQDGFQEWFDGCSCAARDMVKRLDAAYSAVRLLHGYLKKNQEQALGHCVQLFFYTPDDFLLLDAATQRNLELVKNLQDSTSANTLFAVLDQAVTPMGSRMIKKWLVRPLLKKEAIEQRLQAVEFFVAHVALMDKIVSLLQDVGDVERVVGRLVLQRAHLHDYCSLKRALEKLPAIMDFLLSNSSAELLQRCSQVLTGFESLSQLLSNALQDDASSDWKIKAGYNPELDRLRGLMQEGAQAIAELERKEQQRTGINSLKIRYNNIHGYSFEITQANLGNVPPEYKRLQTLVNRERFTSQELRDLEYDIARSQTESVALEKQLYEQVEQKVLQYAVHLKKMAQGLAQCDALLGLARSAYRYNFVRPIFYEKSDNRDICITAGRHPVVAARLGHSFIPNDTHLIDEESTWIITGPNMGGKSTYLRQVALIGIMAQIGSFVPADRAQLPLLDRIFTRIGAADNVAEGKSTFLVEMEETALICNQATAKSLVILDEVGRGTSTYDGLAIAQAVVEYLHTRVKARALFATHYHELTALAQTHAGVAVYHAASTQTPRGIILLHKIIKGCADGSFGLEVAKTVELPAEIIMRAELILSSLKVHKDARGYTLPVPVSSFADTQLLALQEQNKRYAARITSLEQELAQTQKVAQKITSLDYNNLSPKQAFDVLWELKS